MSVLEGLSLPSKNTISMPKRDPKPDSWEWERAGRAVYNLLRRVLWRINKERK